MTQRPRRRRLVPAWLLPTVLATVLVLLAGGLLARANYRASLVAVPDMIGRPGDVAEQNAGLSGLALEVSGQQFSADVAQGSVVSQEPSAGSRVKKGTTIHVVLSAGSETLSMPDVIGMSLQQVKQVLRELGLGAATHNVVSSAEAGTVLESFPGPGADVRTGTTVRLSIAIGGAAGDSLLPYDLRGKTIAIDPAPAGNQSVDVTLDVTRRLRSLLEASGATVPVSRSVTESAPPVEVRSSLLSSPTPDATIGLSITLGQPGVTAVVVRSSDSTITMFAETLARSFTGSLRLPGQEVNAYRTSTDDVLGKVLAPGVRVSLGDPSDPADAQRFADPSWADAVARALYRAIGETLAAGQG